MGNDEQISIVLKPSLSQTLSKQTSYPNIKLQKQPVIFEIEDKSQYILLHGIIGEAE